MKINAVYILFFLLLNIYLPVFGQDIRINEVSSSNSKVIVDNDVESSDWFELFNNSSNKINLSNYFISDDINNLTKWQFPNVELKSDSLLLVFASGKDRKERVEYWETIFREGDNCKYLVPQSNPSSNWNSLSYNDATWTTGQTGIGNGDNDDNTIIPQTVSAFIRCKFTIDDINQISSLFLHMDFDDGFVAYLNGQEIARENLGLIGSKVYYNTLATAEHEAQLYTGNPINSYPLNDKLDLLQNGENVLAIEVHNVSTSSSDLTIIPFLSLGYNYTPTNSRERLDFLSFPKSDLHTNFKLSSTGELLILSKANGEIEDSIFTRNQLSDISLGRFPNGSDNLFFFNSPTPGKKNIDDGFASFLQPPTFSKEHGFYETPFFLDISNPNSTGTIRYSIDGSEPTKYSTVYSNQIVISGTSVIRAKIFANGLIPSQTVTNTFFVNTTQRLPIVSLSTNPDNFFSSDSGIYVLGPNAESANPNFGANFWQDWERPIHVEFFEDNNAFGFAIDCGVKISGQWSRANPQKSLTFFVRDVYGFSEINYKLFPNSEIDKYQNFTLRNSGNEWNNTMFRDALMHEIVSPIDIDIQNYRPVVVYLNGEYWGIHNLREKVNEHYIESHHGIAGDDLNILENDAFLVHGMAETYVAFYNSLANMNMSTSTTFDYINSKVDVNEFIDYCIAEIFFDNRDWPGNNIKYWQQQSTNSKWRWILYDTDFGFGFLNPTAYNQNTLLFALEANGPGWPNPPWSTYLLRKFLQNETFKNLFISRYSTYTNTIFSPASINKIITNFSNRISSEMPTHFQRWGGYYPGWSSRVNILRTFANLRSTFVSSHFMSYFGIYGQYKLTIEQDITKGEVEITDYKIEENIWSGNFFNNIPLKVNAVPKPEFIFSHWEGNVTSTENPIYITSSEKLSISPVYTSVSDTQIVINEINYNSSNIFNPDDWIELYNYSDQPIDLSGWIFKDEDPVPVFVIPENTIIDSKAFVVLCRDTVLFKSRFPNVKNYYGNFGFGLSGGGELISLFNNTGLLIDSLIYDDKEPWPPICDGGGPSLELKNYNLDNSKYINWEASSGFGTPGEINSIFTSVKNNPEIYPSDFKLFQNFPNPFNPSTTIKYSIPFSITHPSNYSREGKERSDRGVSVTLKVYNILGQEVSMLVNKEQQTGNYDVQFDAGGLTSGIYYYKLQSGSFSETKKMILLK